MKRARNASVAIGVVATLAIVLSLGLLPQQAGAPELDIPPPPPPPGGGGGGGCSYCTQNNCGCASPQAGCSLDATCTCGSTCTVTCNYHCE